MIDVETINKTELLPTMTLGGRIKRIREIRGINQKEMATKMKVTAQTYGNIEEGINPRYSTLKKFCDTVGIDVAFLLSEEVAITDDNIQFFDNIKEKCFLLTHEQMRQKVEVYTDLLQLNEYDSVSMQKFPENDKQ